MGLTVLSKLNLLHAQIAEAAEYPLLIEKPDNAGICTGRTDQLCQEIVEEAIFGDIGFGQTLDFERRRVIPPMFSLNAGRCAHSGYHRADGMKS